MFYSEAPRKGEWAIRKDHGNVRERARTACKNVEKEMSRIVELTSSEFPELPLLFPDADIMRIAVNKKT